VKEELYRKEREGLIDAEREAARSFDKAMITLSAGALALSIAFIRDIAPHPTKVLLLYSAWGAFGGSLFLILLSFLCSQSGMRRQRHILNECDEKGIDRRSLKNRWRKLISCLNWLSAIVFLVGVVFLAFFVGCNLAGKE